jgi:hypothetical protein
MSLQVNVQEIILFRNIKDQSKVKTESSIWSEKEKNTEFGLVGC